jgi:tetratricopeptide (TPR) repeat protein
MKKMRITCYITLIFAFLIGPPLICSDSQDSLLNALKKQGEDTLKVKTLLNLADEFRFNDARQSLNYAQQALILAEQLQWKRGIALASFHMSGAYDNLGQFAKALELRLQEVEKWRELGNRRNVCTVLGNIGVSYSNMGDNVRAMQYYIKALKVAEEIGNEQQIINSLTNIGTIYMEQANYAKALEYYHRALKYSREHGLKPEEAINCGNIGNVQLSLANYTAALFYYQYALRIDDSLANKRNSTAWLANMAGVYEMQSDSAKKAGNPGQAAWKSDSALNAYKRALQLAREIGNRFIEAHTLGNIGSVHLAKQDYKEAEEYISASLGLAKEIGSVEVMRSSYNKFYLLYRQTNKPDKALAYHEKYIAIRDSLSNLEHRKAISELEIKYDTEKKEAENAILAQKSELQALEIKNSRYMLAGLSGVLILVGVIGFLLVRQGKLHSRQLAIQYEQKLLRTQMNPHFIFNSLASIESFIYEHQPKEAGSYLSSFSRLMRLVLENSTLEQITLEKEVEILTYYLALQKLRLDDNLSYNINIDPTLQPDQVYLPPMLCQPFIENAIEHGFRGSKQPGHINIDFRPHPNSLQVAITDNGIGVLKARQEQLHRQHKSMAVQLTKERLAYLNKRQRLSLSFTVEDLSASTSQSGTRVTFTIPIS